MPATNSSLSTERLENLVYVVRGERVMLDSDLAALYGVTTGVLNQAVKRNSERFPEDFCFQLSVEEWTELAETAGLAVAGTPEASPALRSQIVTLKPGGRGQHRKYRPYAFTEQGVAMLSSVLRSERAVQVNIEIMRAFVRLRQLLSSNASLARKLDGLEEKYDAQFKIVFDAIRALMTADEEPTPQEPKREIGFHTTARSARSNRRK